MQIELTQGKYAEVDADNYDLVSQWKWCFNGNYAVRSEVRYIDGTRKAVRIPMHRFILDAPRDKQVDHIDRDKLNNRRDNLRLATPAQNCQNRDRLTKGISGHIGINWRPTKKLWRVRIMSDGRRIERNFKDLGDAITVRRELLAILHGEFGVGVLKHEN